MQWIINNLYINNQLSIPDVFNRLSIDVQWNINYYWTILVTDSKGKLLPRLSKHHQWTNLQLGVWSQRCSMLMHCPSMQVKSPSLVFVCLLLSSDRVFAIVFNPTQRRPACGELHRGYLFPTLILLHAGKVYPEQNDKDNFKE